MATWKERLLARMDRLFVGRDGRSSHPQGYVEGFYGDWGGKMAMINPDGNLSFLGSYWKVNHIYDNTGNLLKRIVLRRDLKSGQRIVLGHEKSSEAWHNQPRERARVMGGCVLEI